MNIPKDSKIYIAGHKGMVGSALMRAFAKQGYTHLIGRSIEELDLRDSSAVTSFFQQERPDVVVLAAAKVGGIQANIARPAEFLYDNLVIQNNVIHQSYLTGVKHFCFLGSSCVYPRECRQPMTEDQLMTGILEPTNEGYALAKLAGMKMVQYYRQQYNFSGITVLPCNLYGTNDSYDPAHSHVLTAMVRRIVDAAVEGLPSISIWGTGTPKREFLHVDDAAEGVVFLMNNYAGLDPINLGCGADIAILELAKLVAAKVKYRGAILTDPTKPDGMMRKCMDVSRLNQLGFTPKISLEQGVEMTIKEYLQKHRPGVSL